MGGLISTFLTHPLLPRRSHVLGSNNGGIWASYQVLRHGCGTCSRPSMPLFKTGAEDYIQYPHCVLGYQELGVRLTDMIKPCTNKKIRWCLWTQMTNMNNSSLWTCNTGSKCIPFPAKNDNYLLVYLLVPFDVFVALLPSSLFFLWLKHQARRQEAISNFSQASTWRSQCNYLSGV